MFRHDGQNFFILVAPVNGCCLAVTVSWEFLGIVLGLRIGYNFRTQIILELEPLEIQSVFVCMCFCFQAGIPETSLELVVGNRLSPFFADDRFADDTARLDSPDDFFQFSADEDPYNLMSLVLGKHLAHHPLYQTIVL